MYCDISLSSSHNVIMLFAFYQSFSELQKVEEPQALDLTKLEDTCQQKATDC
jgi:hypothetical protein